ncbi:transglycosylase SLT domain-containing protein [Amycolatopsis nigrescens]|uniref:transglycosylase SLT domain-containing protein n=1 Tax=Amycolatopsis nigrescens TaxID=381445 RepID=UPI0003714695|nr:transglycosylase SLT domain-containing protein [Amycolatopsis nigrescens]
MSKLTAEQIAQHAYQAGFRGQGLSTAVAVALAESGGNSRAHNGTPPDNSYGLWQINMLGGMGPERRRQFHLESNKELFSPAENAKVAYALSSHGKYWRPWSTYTNGAYRKYLGAARKAAHAVTEKGGKHPKGDGGPAPGRFQVDTDALGAYTKRADAIAGELKEIGGRTVRAVHNIAEDSFGKIGRETGFAAALGGFSQALRRQVAATGSNAHKLGVSTSKVSKVYREHEDDIAKDLKNLF